jgi:serine/threonine protein kinase
MNTQEKTTLARQLNQGSVAPETVGAIAVALAQSLRELHEKGSVFGNLTPDTIEIEDGAVILLAGARQDGLNPYSSPEQAQGGAVDARSDIYSLGAILYEIVSGRPPVAWENGSPDPDELRRAILEDEPRPLPNASPSMERLVRRCLAKDPLRRWQRIGAVLIELKLAGAAARHARQAPEWKGMVASLGFQLDALERRVAAHQAAHETGAAQVRQSVSALEAAADEQRAHAVSVAESIVAVRSSLSKLENLVHAHGRAILAVEAAVTQTDEVMEHVVEAFDQMHRSMVEHGEAKAFVVSNNGN